MLNRRFLRVKAFQSLFAYKQANEAEKQIVMDDLKAKFQPDLNSMNPRDTDELRAKRELSNTIFKEYLTNQEQLNEEDAPADIKSAVHSAFETIRQHAESDLKHNLQQSLNDFERIEQNVVRILLAVVQLSHIAKQRLEDPAKSKKLTINLIPFINSPILKKLEAWDQLETRGIKLVGGITDMLPALRKTFLSDILSSDYLHSYVEGEQNFENDKTFVLELIKKGIFKSEQLKEYFSENDLSWGFNEDIVKSLVVRVIKDLESPDDKPRFPTLSQNWEEDLDFFKVLFNNFPRFEAEAEVLLKGKVKNWDFERVALTDQVILKMALTEILVFKNIPVKVSVNEYIELAKNYSTPDSKKFVNGVLDSVVQEMQKKGLIKKSGRGLIDNK